MNIKQIQIIMIKLMNYGNQIHQHEPFFTKSHLILFQILTLCPQCCSCNKSITNQIAHAKAASNICK